MIDQQRQRWNLANFNFLLQRCKLDFTGDMAGAGECVTGKRERVSCQRV